MAEDRDQRYGLPMEGSTDNGRELDELKNLICERDETTGTNQKAGEIS